MKKFKKAVTAIGAIGLSLACLAVPAFAKSYHLPDSYTFTDDWRSDTLAFNGAKVRFICTPSCSKSGAELQIELHDPFPISTIPVNQVVAADGNQQRAWWNTKTNSYYVKTIALNNNYNNGGSRASISIRDVWIENFADDVWKGSTVY